MPFHITEIEPEKSIVVSKFEMSCDQCDKSIRVPIKVEPGERIFHDPINSTHKCVVQQRSVDQLMIRITDERNRVVDLNGPDLNIALQLDFPSEIWQLHGGGRGVARGRKDGGGRTANAEGL